MDQVLGGIDLPRETQQAGRIQEVRFDHVQAGFVLSEVCHRKAPPVADNGGDFMARFQQRLNQPQADVAVGSCNDHVHGTTLSGFAGFPMANSTHDFRGQYSGKPGRWAGITAMPSISSNQPGRHTGAFTRMKGTAPIFSRSADSMIDPSAGSRR